MAAVKVSAMIQNQGSFGGEIAVENLHWSEAIQGYSQEMYPSTAHLLLDLSVILGILGEGVV